MATNGSATIASPSLSAQAHPAIAETAPASHRSQRSHDNRESSGSGRETGEAVAKSPEAEADAQEAEDSAAGLGSPVAASEMSAADPGQARAGSSRINFDELDDFGFLQSKKQEYHADSIPRNAAEKFALQNFDTGVKEEIVNMNEYRAIEKKWVDCLSNWDESMAKKSSLIKKMCREGVPSSLRGRVWFLLAGAQPYKTKNPTLFKELCQRPVLPIYSVIERDINRSYPDHFLFVGSQSQGCNPEYRMQLLDYGRVGGKSDLRKETFLHQRFLWRNKRQRDLECILKAYAHYNPEVGYCQGMGRLVGMMLMEMPTEESFWLLVATIDRYMKGYFEPSLEQLQIDAAVFGKLLESHYPKVWKHLQKNGIEPILFMTQWFMTLFTMTLPWSTVLRMWDMFFFEGTKILFRFGLGIIDALKDILVKDCPTSTELMTLLLHIPVEYLQPSVLIPRAMKLSLSSSEIARMHARVILEKANRTALVRRKK